MHRGPSRICIIRAFDQSTSGYFMFIIHMSSEMNRNVKLLRSIYKNSLFIALYLNSFASSTSKMMKAVVYQPGGAENLSIGTVGRPLISEQHIMIKAHYFAVNRADILQRKGLYPPPKGESDILGLEVAGVIEEVGQNCSKDWKKGQRVMSLLGGGGYAEYVSTHEALVIPVPDQLSLSDAAAIPEVWLTAYQLLHLLGNIKAGEHVLVHAAGSGVGTAATQLSKLAKAHPLATAGTTEKLNMAEKMGAEGRANYKNEDFSEMVLSKTNGSGANVILDCVGSSFFEQNLKSIATDGRWVLYGLLGGPNVSGSILGGLLRKRVHLLATTLRTRSLEYKKNLVEKFVQDALPHFQTGMLTPVVDQIFDMKDIQKAHIHMESNQNIGKIVVRVVNEGLNDEL